MDLGFAQSFGFDFLLQFDLVILFQFVVLLTLRLGHFAGEKLLGFGGQFFQYLRLCPPQEKRLQSRRQRLDRSVVIFVIRANPSHRFEARKVPQHPRIKKLKQRPQFAKMVFDRRSGHRQAKIATQQTTGLGNQRGRIFDRLRFIQNRIVKLNLAQPLNINPHCRVGGQQNIKIAKFVSD